MTQVFLLGNVGTIQTFPDPGNWNPTNNIVECVGSGGTAQQVGPFSSGGGGGGAYAFGQNIAPTWPAYYCIGSPGGAGPYATNFNVNSANNSTQAGCVSAASGAQGLNTGGGAGGAGGNNFYPAGFSGGTGGNNGGGGGGAGGPHGAGSNGVATSPFNGGAADGGIVPGPANAGQAGTSGKTWDTSHGCGSGGAGSATTGGAGGSYGGGGGGCGSTINNNYGPGIVVLTYLPLGMTQIFIIPSGFGGQGSFPDPGNWNPTNNKVELISAGGSGGPYSALNPNGGGGGGGGAYAYATNQNFTFPVPWYLWGTGSSGTGSYSVFGSTNQGGGLTSGPGVSATNGSAALQGGSGGGGGASPYPSGYVGGNGAKWNSVSPTNGGGGGGAAGPHGAGLNASASITTYAIAGAPGDAGVTPGQANGGSPGWTGTQLNPWGGGGAWYGSGGGGPGGSGPTPTTTRNGNPGGNYGGGGGGVYQASGYTQGTGGSSIVSLTYLPLLPSGARAIIMA